MAARETRKHKRFEPVGQLMGRWRAELAEVGWPVSRLRDSIERSAGHTRLLGPMTAGDLAGLVRTVLDGDGELARRKVFGRAQIIVAVAPHLFGRPTDDLDRAVAAVLAHAEVIPLVGVAGARDRQYTLAGTVATELAIASLVAEGAAALGAGRVAEPAVAAAVARVEARLGCPLTVGQREAVSGICGGGRQVSLVLGVAGSGKTTCLSAAADAYQAAGYRVVGTATSGQAARTLAREADMGESRTVASLLWQIDHGRLRLDARTVLILDEAGMTDDPDLLKLLAAANAQGTKVVLVGDDRQLGPVGPGGALRALLRRHHSSVHVLGDNVRQADPGERRALAQLRAGDIGRAVAWYRQAGRIRPAADQDAAIAAVVEAWARDVAAGANSVILAWRRASVERLNQQARAAWAAMGHLRGPELQAPGGRRYAAGDLIVALAPTADPAVPTSQRGQVVHVDQQTNAMIVHLDDGRNVRLAREQLAADRLAHSYALTVHRAQGLTTSTCHHLADGGGRELAYVAMSRARTSTTVHVVGDDIDQAADDLCREWARDTRARWAIDTGTPGQHHPAGRLMFSPEAAHQLAVQARQVRLRAERDALKAAIPADATRPLVNVEWQLRQASEQLDQIRQGRYQGTDRRLAEAARLLHEAASQRVMAESVVSYGNLGWRMGRAWKRDLARFSQAERLAQTAWQQAAAPEIKQLSDTIEQLERTRSQLRGDAEHRSDWLAQHPEAYERLDRVERLLHAHDLNTPVPEGRNLSPDRMPASCRIPPPPPKYLIPKHPYPAVAQQQPHLDRGIDVGL